MSTNVQELRYNLVVDDGEPSSVTVFASGRAPLVATKEHRSFQAILNAVTETGTSEQEIIDLFDTGQALNGKFSKVSDRVSIRGGSVYFDNVLTDNTLTDAMVRFYLAGHEDYMALVNFMEKIEQNPNPHSREHLFRWLKGCKFSITPDGDIIGYKYVNRQSGVDVNDEYYQSTVAGPAIVDGEPVNGHVPQRPGVIVEMARNEVTFDPHVTCSHGLHVGDWSYSGNSHSNTLMVLVNPRDVVSVPVDAQDHKMRVCRYKVLKSVTAEETSMLHVDNALHTLTARLETWKPKQLVTGKATTTKTVKKAPAKVAKKAAASTPKPTIKQQPKKPDAPIKTTKAKSTTIKPVKLPKYYEEFKLEHFAQLPYTKLQWLMKQWEVKVPAGVRTAAALSKELAFEASKRMTKAHKVKDQTKVS